MVRDGVYAVSTPDGSIELVVETRQAIELFIEHLEGQIEWVEENHVDPPYIFHRAPTGFEDEKAAFDEYDAFLDDIKEGKMDLYHWGISLVSSLYGMTVVVSTLDEMKHLVDILKAHHSAFEAPYVMRINQ